MPSSPQVYISMFKSFHTYSKIYISAININININTRINIIITTTLRVIGTGLNGLCTIVAGGGALMDLDTYTIDQAIFIIVGLIILIIIIITINYKKKSRVDLDTYTMDQAIFIITLLVILIVIILKITIRYKKVTWTLIPTNTMTLQMSTKVLV